MYCNLGTRSRGAPDVHNGTFHHFLFSTPGIDRLMEEEFTMTNARKTNSLHVDRLKPAIF